MEGVRFGIPSGLLPLQPATNSQPAASQPRMQRMHKVGGPWRVVFLCMSHCSRGTKKQTDTHYGGVRFGIPAGCYIHCSRPPTVGDVITCFSRMCIVISRRGKLHGLRSYQKKDASSKKKMVIFGQKCTKCPTLKLRPAKKH